MFRTVLSKSLITFVILSFLVGMFLPIGKAVFAETYTYSEVMTDLQKDSSFSIANFPVNNSDYSVCVFAVGESSDNKLLLYVYQPTGLSKAYTCTHVNMSYGLDSTSNQLYTVTLCSYNGVFYKYLVNDFAITDVSVRYYNIASIYRPFDASVDVVGSNNNEVNAVSFSVAKTFACGSSGGSYSVEVQDFEVIEITDKFVGYCKYNSGYPALGITNAINSHFVAFSASKPIDKLMSATVSYQTSFYSYSLTSDSSNPLPLPATETYGSPVAHTVVLDENDSAISYTTTGMLGRTYTWNRIQSVSDFIANETMTNVYSGFIIDASVGSNLTSSTLTALQTKSWVLRFAETENITSTVMPTFNGTITNHYYQATFVSNVTILRLKFMTSGVVYNLGVVDNLQTGSQANESTQMAITLSENMADFLGDFVLIIALLLGVAIFIVVLPPILKGCKAIFNFFVQPFKSKKSKKR